MVTSKTFANGLLGFKDLKIKRGDGIQVSVIEVIDAQSGEKVKIAKPYISFFAK